MHRLASTFPPGILQHRKESRAVPIILRLTALVVLLALAAACGGAPPAASPEPAAATERPSAATREPVQVDPAQALAADAGTPAAPSPDAPSPDAPDPRAPSPEPVAAAPTGEPAARQGVKMRAAWVHLFDDTLKTRAGIAALVDELAAAGANAVIAQVARRHDAYYASDVLPVTADPDLEPGLDVVAELTSRAHAAGLEVHAWFSVAPTWHGIYDDIPAPAGWIGREHAQDAPESQRWVTREDSGEWSDFLDPALPQVREHAAAVAAELAERYPVDGIHLDYVRYASERHGYHPDALARYRAETGASGTPAPRDPAWMDWRRRQTRAVVERVGEALDATGRDVVLSAAVIAWGGVDGGGFAATRTAGEALQDWHGWVRDGLVDAVMPMNYFRAADAQQARWFGEWIAFQQELAAASDTLVVPGIAGYLNPPDAGLAQMHAAMRAADGAVMYSYQQPTEDHGRGIWGMLADSGWGEPAP